MEASPPSARHRPSDHPPRVLIVGAGFSGLCLGIQLKQAGLHGFTILEKADRLGGTWRENVYPGAACDVPSLLYCFSFEQKTDWSRKWSPQPEILAYMDHCADKYGVRPHIRFGCEVERADFDADAGVWRVRLAGGEELTAEFLVSGVGQLHRPQVPDLPGLERFAGPCFHSARWDATVPLEGRRVAVVGNAASAIQLIPQVAKRAAHVTVFQRSANWMMPRGDRTYTEEEKARFARQPWRAKLHRFLIWARLEIGWLNFRQGSRMNRYTQRMALKHLAETVPDPELRRKLTPDYPIGGKRILISDDYYACLLQDHVDLVTEPIRAIEADAVVTEDGARHSADVLVLATGFQTTEFLAPMEIRGLGGRRLADDWSDGARAYLGIAVPAYPNLFLMYGPNTNLGHNSIIFMIECQTRYILDLIERMLARDLQSVDLRPDVLERFDREVQTALARTPWAATDRSWYKTRAGRITNNWMGTVSRYWWRTRRADLTRYRQRARDRAAPVADAETPPRVAASG